MGRTCSTNEERRGGTHIGSWWESQREGDH
jgi:hypothetical protein